MADQSMLEASLSNLSIQIDPELLSDGESSGYSNSELESDIPPSVLRPPSPSPPPRKHESLQGHENVSEELQNYTRLVTELVGEVDPFTAKATVVLSPESYKHVFARPWVSKRYLSSIVERPERLKAAALGIGTAQTLVPIRVIESQRRVSLYSPHFEKVHGSDWATQLYALCSQSTAKHARDELEVPESWPSGDIYLCEGTLSALEGSLGALEQGTDSIFDPKTASKRAFVAVRPPGHHGHEDAASGFCIMNNAHIAIQYAHAQHKVTHAVIMDFDLHHGDGSQSLVWKLGFKTEGPADIPIGYFSIHDINSFPCEYGYAEPEKLANASVCLVGHNTAVWNIHFEPYGTPEEFDILYSEKYSVLFKRAAEFLSQCRRTTPAGHFKPLVVISAGFDGSEYESHGMQRHKVNVPTSFFNRFTRDCVALAENYGDGHVLSLMEGGYSTAAIATGVLSHLTGLCGRPYEPKWCSPEIAKEFERATRQRWRPPATWTGAGMQLGRTLFPIPPPEPKPPVSTGRVLRERAPSSSLTPPTSS